jgi:hypothetical protein
MTTTIASVISRPLSTKPPVSRPASAPGVSRRHRRCLLEMSRTSADGTNSATHPASAADSFPSQSWDQGRLRA